MRRALIATAAAAATAATVSMPIGRADPPASTLLANASSVSLDISATTTATVTVGSTRRRA